VTRQTKAKQERIIEAFRQGLDGEVAVRFVRESGFAMTALGLARLAGKLGGRDNVLRLIEDGYSNDQVLQRCLPEDEHLQAEAIPPNQPPLFVEETPPVPALSAVPRSIAFEHTKLTLRVPNDLYAAIKLAAHAEGKSRTDLVVDILTRSLSSMPGPFPAETSDGQWDEGDGYSTGPH